MVCRQTNYLKTEESGLKKRTKGNQAMGKEVINNNDTDTDNDK